MLEKLKIGVRERMSEERYRHTLNVMEKATELAVKYDADVYRCEVGALLHDVAKEEKLSFMQSICRLYYAEELEESDFDNTEILHGFVGDRIARDVFGITDKIILECIKYHTIGKKYISKEALIVYLADAIEKERDYPGVNILRELAKKDLYLAAIEEIDMTKKYLNKIGKKIHKNTLEMRDWLLKLKGVENEH